MYTYILNALVLMHTNVIVRATTTHPHITYTTVCTIDELFHNVYVHTTTFPHAKHITHNHHTNTIVYMQDGFFPLFVACQKGHDRIVEKFIQAGAIVDLQNKVFLYLSLVMCHVLYSLYTKYHTIFRECEDQRVYPTQPQVISMGRQSTFSSQGTGDGLRNLD